MKNKPKIEPINWDGNDEVRVEDIILKLNEIAFYLNALLDEKDNILKKEK